MGLGNSCFRFLNSDFLDCQKYCAFKDKNITCENGKYLLGETVAIGCRICKCKDNGKLSCKKTDFCNFQDISTNKDECMMSGGLYQQLCNGPYFDIVCSKDHFCLCEGINNYSCAPGYKCLKEFSNSLTRKSNTIPGWKTLLGFSLGDIGICTKVPELINCGNGICENKICKNCPEPETSYNCPEDC